MRPKLTHTASGVSGERGQALIELAITLLLLVVLMMGVYDYSRAIHAQSIITNMSREAANLVSRANVNLSGTEATDVQNIMDLIGKTAQPLDMVNQGMMYVYKVERVNGQYTTTPYSWTRSVLSSKPSASNSLGGATLLDGQTAYGVEVYYQYRSIFLGSLYQPTLRSISIF
jgi:Flp pilus assembly protein TadG